jgi:uncharacterized flavoprotein (TIGR03862 family)
MNERRLDGMCGECPNVAIVGAGPAGLIAAEKLSEAGLAVTVYERMPSVGRKFLMAGRGGLNLTHSEPLAKFLPRYGPAEPHLAAAIEAFPPAALRAWAAGLGQPTFVGSSGRVFPASLKASPLLRAWLARLARRGVAFRLRREWRGWDSAGRLQFRGRDGALEKATGDATLLALGGASWPKLGSNGAWTDILAARGVDIVPLWPANCGFEIAWTEHFRDRFAGQPLKNVALSFAGQRTRGEAVVTRYGIEGGAVYALSAALRDAILHDGKAVPSLDLRPDLSRTALTKRLAGGPARQSLANRLRKAGLSPLAANLLREAAGPDLPRDPAALAGLAKALPLTLVAPQSLERAISTAGGVAFAALDENLMLRALPGVFAAGEMLDWEAPTGGYLLQASFATGVAAAKGMLARLQGRFDFKASSP